MIDFYKNIGKKFGRDAYAWWWWRSFNRPYISDDSYLDYVKQIPEGSLGLDVGSGSGKIRNDAISVDISKDFHPDIVADATNLPFASDSFDYVWSNAALEHMKRPWLAAYEMIRVLKPNGVIIIQVPFLECGHSEPNDYYRFSIYGLRSLFEELEEVSSGVSAGPGQVLSDLMEFYGMLFVNNTIEGWKSLFLTLLCIPIGIFLYPIKRFDACLKRRYSYRKWARAVYYIGKKSLPKAPSAGPSEEGGRPDAEKSP